MQEQKESRIKAEQNARDKQNRFSHNATMQRQQKLNHQVSCKQACAFISPRPFDITSRAWANVADQLAQAALTCTDSSCDANFQGCLDVQGCSQVSVALCHCKRMTTLLESLLSTLILHTLLGLGQYCTSHVLGDDHLQKEIDQLQDRLREAMEQKAWAESAVQQAKAKNATLHKKVIPAM